MTTGQSAIAIRPAAVADATGLAQFAAATFREAFAADNSATDLALYIAGAFGPARQLAEIEDPAVDTLLAWAGADLVGYSQLWRSEVPDCVGTQDAIEVRRLYVDVGWRRRGLARQLMMRAFEVADRQGAGTVWLGVWEHNLPAQAFYARLGFAVVGEQRFLLGTDLQTDKILVASSDPSRRNTPTEPTAPVVTT